MLRKFVKATSKGFAEALKDPEKSIEGLMKRAPMTVSKKNIAVENLKMSLTLLNTQHSKGKPIGWMAREDWENTIRLLAKVPENEAARRGSVLLQRVFPGELRRSGTRGGRPASGPAFISSHDASPWFAGFPRFAAESKG